MICVRRSGRVCTVFVDESGRPVPISSFEDTPIGAFPFTLSVDELASKFGGPFTFYQQTRDAAPEAAPVSDADVARAFPKEPTVQLVRELEVPKPAPSPLLGRILAEFSRVVREAPSDVEAVGSFILAVDPGLESALRAAAEAPVEAPKRRFKL